MSTYSGRKGGKRSSSPSDSKRGGSKSSYGSKKSSFGSDRPARDKDGFEKKRKSFDDRGERGSYKKKSLGDDRGERKSRSYGDSSERGGFKKKSYGDADRGEGKSRSYGDSKDRGGFKKKSYGDDDRGERKSRSYVDSSERGGFKKKSYGDDDRGERKSRSYGDSSERGGFKKKSYGDDDRGEGKSRSYGDSKDRGGFKKKSYGDDGGERKSRSYGDSSERGGFKKKSYGDDGGERKSRSYGDSSERGGFKKKSYGDDDRGERKSRSYGDSSERGGFKKKSYGDDRGGFKKSYSDRNAGGPKRRFSESKFSKDEDGQEDGWVEFDGQEDAQEFVSKQSRNKKVSYKGDANDNGAIRLNRFIANTGLCSRREADELIAAGAVKVNGKFVTELGTKVTPGDTVHYGDQLLRRESFVYVLLNKPKDYITTTDDPQERRTVMELVKDACKERIYPVGRLDRQTVGLLLLTNDGDLSERLMHPKYGVRKIYHVTLDKNLKAEDFEAISEGVTLEDGPIKVDEINYVGEGTDRKQVGVVLHSGRNRIVRRLFEHLGYNVVTLDRVLYAGLTKKNLARGKWRFLSTQEIGMLKMQVGGDKKQKAKGVRKKAK
jgi:23S rRNA pseudouridine2605 synthase